MLQMGRTKTAHARMHNLRMTLGVLQAALACAGRAGVVAVGEPRMRLATASARGMFGC